MSRKVMEKMVVFVQVLNGVTTEVERGEMCVIQGTSGSGKSTLLNCIGGLDTMDSGSVKVAGTEIFGMKKEDLLEYRRANLGFIFQFYNLVPNLTVRENIQVCEFLTDNPLSVDELLDTLGLTEHQNKFPFQLSGGQQQRCAIARALVKNPKLLLCDEPTGALDSKTSREILILLEKINAQYGTTMLIVTHNNSIKQMVHRVIFLKDGQIKNRIRMKQEYRQTSWRIYKMQKILRKRVLRDLKENFFRYLALGLLIILCMYMIGSLVGAGETIVQGVDEQAEKNHMEDGQFTCFVPLSKDNKKVLAEHDVELEKMFYLDFAKQKETIRVFQNRQKINLVALREYCLAEKKNEIVLERRYAEEHQYTVGSQITLGKNQVSGDRYCNDAGL